MPQVDFTLDDVRAAIRKEVKAETEALRQEQRRFWIEFSDFEIGVGDSFQELAEDIKLEFDELKSFRAVGSR